MLRSKLTIKTLTLLTLSVGMGCAAYLQTNSAAAQTRNATRIPIPVDRYAGPITQNNITSGYAQSKPTTSPIQNIIDNEITGGVIKTASIAAMNGSLKNGLDALSDKDPERARAIRNGMPKQSQDRLILSWAIVQSGLKGVPSAEIAQAIAELKGWPGQNKLRYRWERAVYRENPPAQAVIAAFGNYQPKTAEGGIVLTRALLNTGQKQRAKSILTKFWHNERMDKNDEDEILREFSSILSKADHKKRMDMLLYRDRAKQAKRISELANAQSLYKARAATIRSENNADSLIRSVHRTWHSDPSFLFTQIERARRTENFRNAVQLLKQAPRNKEALVNPGEWWVEQRIASRILYERGDAKNAYNIVANHVAASPKDIAEAEFHAGFFALRGLKNGRLAAKHFEKILQASTQPLSQSRGWYWLGRAAEQSKSGNARQYYANAAQYQSTYYGQLAAAKLGKSSLSVRYPKPTNADRQNFKNRPAVRAIFKLEEAGHAWRADALYRDLAYQLDSPGELAILAARAEKRENYQLALFIGKIAYRRGLNVAALAFPLGAIPSSANISGSGTALAYSIARQESTFNKAAISPANARGLLQLLPTTAKTVARNHGLPYSKARLTSDAAYNATLGAHFLSEQITDFGGSYILTFIAYNAGPRRVPQWIERFGDPRGKNIDFVIDWVEMIPFTETRNYVQRVMENYQVYKTRLGQRSDIVHDLRYGR